MITAHIPRRGSRKMRLHTAAAVFALLLMYTCCSCCYAANTPIPSERRGGLRVIGSTRRTASVAAAATTGSDHHGRRLITAPDACSLWSNHTQAGWTGRWSARAAQPVTHNSKQGTLFLFGEVERLAYLAPTIHTCVVCVRTNTLCSQHAQ